MTRTNLANRIVFALVAFSLSVLIGLYLSVNSIRIAINSQARETSLLAVDSRMSALHDKVRMMARDYNNWADVYLALQQDDIEFVADNYAITAIYGDMFNSVTMFGGSLDEPISWIENGDREPTSTFLSELEMMEIRNKVDSLDFTRRETLDFYMIIGGNLNFLSASFILPDTDALIKSIKKDDLSIGVLARRLRDGEVRDMERALLISDVSVLSHPNPKYTSIPLLGIDDTPVALLSWSPSLNGDILVQTMLPVLLGAVFAFLVMATLGIIAVHRNAEDLVRREKDANALARVDVLTGLANRLAFNEYLANVNGKPSGSVALILIDLNGFKRINDAIGHQGGDQVISLVGHCLDRIDLENGLVARLGGDEFGIVIWESGDVTERVQYLSTRIICELHCTFQIQGHAFDISAAHGASISVCGLVVSEELMRRADYAMYYAKQRKSGRVIVYTETMERVSQMDRQIEVGLRAALDCPSEFSIHYQPIVNASMGHFVRAEALARWEPKFLAKVGPDSFIRIAEDSGLIVPLGWILLDKICGDLKLLPGLLVNMNVSPMQLIDDCFVEEFLRVLKLHGIAPQRIELEVTESVMILNAEIMAQRLAELRQHGFSIALDDFGSGFSSFGSLRALPFDTLKIDKTLVACAAETSENNALLQSVVMLGQSMGKRIVCEGVETEGDAHYLLQTGCDLLQGYFFGRPMAIGDLAAHFFEAERISA